MFRNIKLLSNYLHPSRCCSNISNSQLEHMTINGIKYNEDEWTNITTKAQKYLRRKIYNEQNHPLSILQLAISNYFNEQVLDNNGQPLFQTYDNLDPVTTPEKNFDDLLIPENAAIRHQSECFYLNKQHLLRSHLAAHHADILKTGIENFLLVGDVYRRDLIDPNHSALFHELNAVRTIRDGDISTSIFEKDGLATDNLMRSSYTPAAIEYMEHDLKTTWTNLLQHLFKKSVDHRWIETESLLASPCWDLELTSKQRKIKILRSGIMRSEFLIKCGVTNAISWNFSLGLERLAMMLFDIPDIRLFMSKDSGFLNQFYSLKPLHQIKYRNFLSEAKLHTLDISFWLSENVKHDEFNIKDYLDLIRTMGGDNVEQVSLHNSHIAMNSID